MKTACAIKSHRCVWQTSKEERPYFTLLQQSKMPKGLFIIYTLGWGGKNWGGSSCPMGGVLAGGGGRKILNLK